MKEEVEVICNMAICPDGQQDKMIWAGTKNGTFTVRSAYHLAHSLGLEERGACSSMGATKDIWSKIWALKGPRNGQLFIWKACQNALPTKANLYHSTSRAATK
jgi:hypothetical protein